MEFQSVWELIVGKQGQTFHTITGLPFTYEVHNGSLQTSRTGFKLSKSDFETAFRQLPVGGPADFNGTVRGSSYIYAILHQLCK